MRIDGSHLPTRPGPALPGITGYKREVCTPSPAPVQPAPGSPNTCRTGMMPKPSANKSDELSSAEPAPAPPKAVSAQMTSLTSERIVQVVNPSTCVNRKGTIILMVAAGLDIEAAALLRLSPWGEVKGKCIRKRRKRTTAPPRLRPLLAARASARRLPPVCPSTPWRAT
jgi:hypothetical protein